MSAIRFGRPTLSWVGLYGRSPHSPIEYSKVFLFVSPLPPIAMPAATAAPVRASGEHRPEQLLHLLLLSTVFCASAAVVITAAARTVSISMSTGHPFTRTPLHLELAERRNR
jgi:hypothetical protein